MHRLGPPDHGRSRLARALDTRPQFTTSPRLEGPDRSDLWINDGTLGNWVNRWRRENPEPVPDLNPVERARGKEMEDELRRQRMENEFLKNARTQP